METKNKKSLGNFGEAAAMQYLIKSNYTIRDKNFRFGRMGEIDIIARDKEYLCFIEVKTRSSNLFGEPAEAINYRKKENIIKLSKIYAKIHKLSDSFIRFDVIEVIAKRAGENFSVKSINLIKNAF